MRIRCPHCHNPIEVVGDDFSDVECSSCGSHFSLISGDTTAVHDPSGHRTIGHFELVHQVGIGAFGSVWKARDTQLDRTVAIKIPRRDQLSGAEADAFFREARAAAQLRHPQIVGVHEVGRDGETIYIVSDFVEGANLREWLTSQRLSPREAAELIAKVAEALHHAHEAGVIHRDLKPGNIMLDLDGHPYLTDFGLAKRESGEISITLEGKPLGTPNYMPPEQAKGEGHRADRRSDIYSLGVILFELLTGEVPFRGEAQMVLVQIQREEPPRLRKLNAKIPRDLETITLKCLEKEPAKRYQTSNALAKDLRRWLDGKPIAARPIGRLARAWRWCKREPMVTTLAASTAIALATGTGITTVFAIQAAENARRADQSAVRASEEAIESKKQAEEALRQRNRADENARLAEESKRQVVEMARRTEEAASELFLRSAETARAAHAADLPLYVLAWAKAQMSSARDKKALTDFAEKLDDFLRTANDDAPGNNEYRCQLHLIRGKLFEKESQPNEALAMYSVLLPTTREDAEGCHAPLLVARATLLAHRDMDPGTLAQALADAQRAKELLGMQTRADYHSLMSYLNLRRSRSEPNLNQQEKFAAAAVAEGEAAIKSPMESVNRASLMLQLADSRIAWADSRFQEPRFAETQLHAAIDLAKKAVQLPALTAEDAAYTILGNAYEDLAWSGAGSPVYASENYDLAIAAYRKVVKTNPSLGSMNLGRCYYKRERDSPQRGTGYLGEAKIALKQALQLKPDYAEAHRWLAAVHEAERDYELAMTHYAQAAELTKLQNSGHFSHYIRRWADVALKSKQPPAPLRAQLLELLEKPELQAADVRKELVLRLATTYEKEHNWQQAIDQYTKEIGASATPLDVDLLRGRADAFARQAVQKWTNSEIASDEWERHASDSDQIVLLAGEAATWSDYFRQGIAHQTRWELTRVHGNPAAVESLNKSVRAYDAALECIAKLRVDVPVDRHAKAELVFKKYFDLLSNAAFRSDCPRLADATRELVKGAPARFEKAAGKVSRHIEGQIRRSLPTIRAIVSKL